MKDKILELLKTQAYDVNELMELLKLPQSDFVSLVKELNKLIDNKQIFINDSNGYELCSSYYRTFVKVKRGSGYVVDGGEEIELVNFNEMSLVKDDEILYRVDKGRAYCVEILKRNTVYCTGIVKFGRGEMLFLPDDYAFKSFKVLNLKDFHKQLKSYTKVRCYISSFERRQLKIDKIIGSIDDPETNVKAILYKNNAPGEFKKDVLAEARNVLKDIRVGDFKDRKDLTDKMFITIDGDDAKDFDDAIYLERNEDGYKLMVAIADVSYYVTENSALDKEALNRGTSIYYPGHVIPMLPFELSDEMCSLMPNVNRLAIVCSMDFDFEGNRTSYDIYPAIIKSHYRMTYKKVNAIFESDPDLKKEYKDLCPMIYISKELSRVLGQRRKEKGNIEFDSDECYFIEEDGVVTDIIPRVQGEAEKVIENFMIEANCTVAEHMNYLDYPMIYRNHDLPKVERISTLVSALEDMGYKFKGNVYELTPTQLQDCLSFFEGKPEYSIVSDMLLRIQSKARYETVCNGHFGLGEEMYCHFTSPIRRYPDLIVHRMLKKYAFKTPNLNYIDEEKENNYLLAEKSNVRENVAVQIERDISDLKKCQYMENHLYEAFDGVICSVLSFGFYVKLPNTVEGLCHVSNLNGYFEFDNGVLTDGITTYKVGDKVKVALIDVSTYKGTIDFEVIKKYK